MATGRRTVNPEAGKVTNPFVVEIERLINESQRTQTDIAHDIGYSNQNLITMFKRGVTRVPENKVVPLAQALGADSKLMLRLWAQTYTPHLLKAFEETMGSLLSMQEQSWIDGVRETFDGQVPMFDAKLLRPHGDKA